MNFFTFSKICQDIKDENLQGTVSMQTSGDKADSRSDGLQADKNERFGSKESLQGRNSHLISNIPL